MISTANTSGSFPGLTLKAWAQVKDNGVLVKGSNIASVTKGATGTYTLNFTAAMAGNSYMVKVQPVGFQQPLCTYISNRTTALATYQLSYGFSNANPVDLDSFIEVWE